MIRKCLLFLLLISTSACALAQIAISSDIEFSWQFNEGNYILAHSQTENSSIVVNLPLDADLNYAVKIKSYSVYKKIDQENFPFSLSPSDKPVLQLNKDKKNHEVRLVIFPFFKNYEKKIVLLSHLELMIIQRDEGDKDKLVSLRGFKNQAVLRMGDIYKIAIQMSGPVKLTKSFFEKNGINISEIDPRNIQVWGQSSGMLPLQVGTERPDGLQQVALYQKGLDDGSFNGEDFIVFYGIGAIDETLSDGLWEKHLNPYSSYNYYFIRLGNESAEVVENENNSISGDEITLNSINIPIHHEIDKVNLLEMQGGNSGSGRIWYGEKINAGQSMDFSSLFNPYSLVPGGKIIVSSTFAGRHYSNTSYSITCNGITVEGTAYSVNLNDNEDSFASIVKLSPEFQAKTDNSLVVSYNGSSGAIGWLGYLNMNVECKLSTTTPSYQFSLPLNENGSNVLIKSTDLGLLNNYIHLWNITDALNAHRITPIKKESTVEYVLDDINVNSKFLLFDENKISSDVLFLGKVPSQNLHSISYADMLIITHPDFIEAAEKLAAHRKDFNGYAVEVINVDEIYNEFSSGKPSPVAIRDFIKMVYDRSPLKYVLLMGDASFDYRHILEKYPDSDYVPMMQTLNSTNYLSSFGYDDFYALLDESEGADIYGDLDVSVGRIPAKTQEEAINVVNKIIHYEISEYALGDWRLRSIFISDDGAGFMKATNQMADRLQDSINPFNPIKIILDAYIQKSYADGDRYPGAERVLNNSIFSGVLLVNYIGHGGPSGWAQERILTMSDIKGWRNFNKLPLFITATCTFSAFDNPGYTSGGEALLLKENGGAIALYSTTRPVYDNYNRDLVRQVFDNIYIAANKGSRQIGKIMLDAKNSLPQFSLITKNVRKFVLLGDPALSLAIPKFKVKATSINSLPIDEFVDTLSALEKVKIAGEVQNKYGEFLPDFNGILSISLYGKPITRKTLGQESPRQVFEFTQQQSILFKGKASILNGKFSFEFIVPKDISYEVGYGKFSFYAQSSAGMADAMGLADSIKIGGISNNIIVDNTPPIIHLYLNDTTFRNGDYTNSDPTLIAFLQDKETGINVTGQSIGHDLIVYLDDDITTTVVLNNFYSSELDNPHAGSLKYLLSNIFPGPHSLTMEAWDLSNNKGSATINFHVTEDDELVIMNVVSSPNPFHNTSKIIIKHNMAGKNLKIRLKVYDAAGKQVKTIEREYANAPATITDLIIDGKSLPTIPTNAYFYTVILEHTTKLGKKIRLVDNDNILIYVH